MAEQWEQRLREAAQKFTLSEADRTRILVKCDARQKHIVCVRRRMKIAAAFGLVVLLTLFPLRMNRENPFEGIYVYAATEDGNWNRLEVGEKQRLVSTYERGREQCVLYLQLPRGYLFDREGARIGEDFIMISKGGIYWYHYVSEPKVDGKASLRLVYTDTDGNRVETREPLELILSREEGECYAELRRIQ